MEYEHLVNNYERYLAPVSSKLIKDFKNTFKSTDAEYYVGLAFQYLMIQIDHTIVLTPDKSDLEDKSWESFQLYFTDTY